MVSSPEVKVGCLRKRELRRLGLEVRVLYQGLRGVEEWGEKECIAFGASEPEGGGSGKGLALARDSLHDDPAGAANFIGCQAHRHDSRSL